MTFEEWWESRGNNWHWTEDKLSAEQAWEAAYTQGHLDAVDHYGEIDKYVLVPVEPSLEMVRAAYRLTHDHFECEMNYEPADVYKAMIKAAQESKE